MKNNMLKLLAMKAKNRMMNRGNSEVSLDARVKIINNQDEEFVERVRSVLSNDKKSMNPMKYLMDEKVLMKLDGMSRERYLLEVTEKYLKAKAIIERENNFLSQGA